MDIQVTEVKVLDRTPLSMTRRGARPRVYFHVEGESLLENFANRFDSPMREYRAHLSEVIRQAKFPPRTKFKWSQKAGCSCGCSPGFVADSCPEGHYNSDVFVTITVSEKQPMTERGVNRALQLVGQLRSEQVISDRARAKKIRAVPVDQV